jgi:hypothetical protein
MPNNARALKAETSSASAALARSGAPLQQIVKYAPGMSQRDILSKPDNTIIEDGAGKKMTVDEIRHRLQQREKSQHAGGMAVVFGKGVTVKYPGAEERQRQVLGRLSEIQRLAREDMGVTHGATAIAGGTRPNASATRPKAASVDPCIAATMAGNRDPLLLSVNKSKNPQEFIPQGEYLIRGCNFGGSPGEVYLLGGFRKRPSFRIDHWQNDMISAVLDPEIGGETDKDGVILVIAPPGRNAVQMVGGYFTAAREVYKLDAIPADMITPNSWKPPAGEGEQGKTLYVGRFSAAQTLDIPPGLDTIHFDRLDPKSAPDSFELFPEEISLTDCDSFGKKGEYRAYWDANNNIAVNWAVSRCHRSPYLFIEAEDINVSGYGINVYVSGPRGLNPNPWR